MQRVLIIEKDEKLVARLTEALEEAGYATFKASDIKTGLRKLHECQEDLVVIAGEMSAKRREEPLQQIKRAAYVPLIVIGDGQDSAQMLELGADAFVAGLPDTREIVARVKALFRRKCAGDRPG